MKGKTKTVSCQNIRKAIWTGLAEASAAPEKKSSVYTINTVIESKDYLPLLFKRVIRFNSLNKKALGLEMCIFNEKRKKKTI